MSRGGEVTVALWFPEIGSHHEYFRVEYDWEEYPEQGNGWDDPGSGGVINIQSVEWLIDFRPVVGGIMVHRCLWDRKWYGDDLTLAERIEREANEQVHQDYYEDDFYDPDEWY